MTYARVALALALSLVAAAGCSWGREATLAQLRTDNPRVQCDTIAQVVRARDKTMVPDLIDLLDAPDEGVRFVAAAGLYRLTGRAINPRVDKDPEKRAALVQEWHAWWEKEGRAASGVPAPKPEAQAAVDARPLTSTGLPKEHGS